MRYSEEKAEITNFPKDDNKKISLRNSERPHLILTLHKMLKTIIQKYGEQVVI